MQEETRAAETMRRGIDLNNHHDPDVRAALNECEDEEKKARELEIRALVDIGEHDNGVLERTKNQKVWTQEMENYIRKNMDEDNEILARELNGMYEKRLTVRAVEARKTKIRKEGKGEF